MAETLCRQRVKWMRNHQPAASAESCALLPDFHPDDYLFDHHNVVLSRKLFPQSELRKKDLEDMAAAVDRDINFENVPSLVKSAGLLELFTSENGHAIMVITEDIMGTTELLRTFFHPRKIVGNLDDHMWMLQTLDFVVATIAQAELVAAKCFVGQSSVDGFVVDQRTTSPEFFAKLRDMLSNYQDYCVQPYCPSRTGFQVPAKLQSLNDSMAVKLSERSWLHGFRPRISEEVMELIRLFLPEAQACPGFLDNLFSGAINKFSVMRSQYKVVSRDGSIFAAFMPGLVRAAVDVSRTGSIVLTSEDRVAPLTELLQRFAIHLGLYEMKIASLNDETTFFSKVHLAVGTPEKVLEFLQGNRVGDEEVKRIALHDTDSLCNSGFKQVILSVLGSPGCRGARVGVHTSDLSPDVEDIIGSCPGQRSDVTKAEFHIRGVRHLYDVVDNKIDRLVKIWKQWGIVKHCSVFCSSVSSVEMVASQLVDAGVEVTIAHTGMDKAAVDEAAIEFGRNSVFLVTNMNFKFGSNESIILDVPANPLEYVEAIEMRRSRNSKIVINLFSEDEAGRKECLEQALGIKMLPLPSTCVKLHKRIDAWDNAGRSGDYVEMLDTFP